MPTTEALLLDTHAWVWFASGDVQLKPKTIEAVQAAGRQGKLYLAAISLWEVAMLAAMEGLHNLLRVRIAALRGVGFGRFASHRLRRCEPTPKLRFRSLA